MTEMGRDASNVVGSPTNTTQTVNIAPITDCDQGEYSPAAHKFQRSNSLSKCALPPPKGTSPPMWAYHHSCGPRCNPW